MVVVIRDVLLWYYETLNLNISDVNFVDNGRLLWGSDCVND